MPLMNEQQSIPQVPIYSSQKHTVTENRYITSSDPRGYIPVYEYPLNGHWLMVDSDNGYILWTGIWKALGNSKADIVKIVESQPQLASQLRRVRGGYLKIQGTWMPYEIALGLARRVAWSIREDLIPLFGPTFPSTCLAPDQPGFGQLVDSSNSPTRRRSRRMTSLNFGPAIPMGLEQTPLMYTRVDNSEESNHHLGYYAGASRGSGGVSNTSVELVTEQRSISSLALDNHPSSPSGGSILERYSSPTMSSSFVVRKRHPSPSPRSSSLSSTSRYSPYPTGERSPLAPVSVPVSSGFQQTMVDNNNNNNSISGNDGSTRLPPPGSIMLPPISVSSGFHRPNSFSQQRPRQYDYPSAGNDSSRIGTGLTISDSDRPFCVAAASGVGSAVPCIPPYSLPPISALDAPGAGSERGFDVLRRLRMDDHDLERDYYHCCNNSGHHGRSTSGSSSGQWVNFDNKATISRHEGRSQSSIIPSFQPSRDPVRPRSASLASSASEGAMELHDQQLLYGRLEQQREEMGTRTYYGTNQ